MAKSKLSRLWVVSCIGSIALAGLFAACSSVNETGAGAETPDGGVGAQPDGAPSVPAADRVIRGTIVGLKGAGLVLKNNGKDDLSLKATDTTFTFATKVANGSAYAVTVATQPSEPAQTCIVTKGSGTATAEVSDVVVTCSTNGFAVGGTITGLVGSGLVLQNNAGDNLTIAAAAGSFAFPTKLEPGAAFAVTILASPASPWQTCAVTGGTGTVVAGDVSSVSINCTTNTYTLGGTVTGLAGSGLIVRAKDDSDVQLGDDLPLNANGEFAFAAPLASGTHYTVSVAASPTGPWQTCAITAPSGIVPGANVTNVAINCTTNSYSVGGTVTGLTTSGLVLQNNAGDDLTVDVDGAFTFPTKVMSNGTYDVTVKNQPGGLTCTVASGSGTATNADVTTVTVTCAACGGYLVSGACWYVAPVVGQTCTTVCAGHGGFDQAKSTHTGNPICTHFYPAKANGSNWVSVECCSTDNNTNWGANGTTADPNFSHAACFVACACNQ